METSAMVGAAAIADGLAGRTGVVTGQLPMTDDRLPGFDALVFGAHQRGLAGV